MELPEGIQKKKVLKAVEALLEYSEKKESGLFDNNARILLEVTAFKTPEGSNHFYNIHLPYSPHNEDPEIVLIIPDVRNADKEINDPEFTSKLMKERLAERSIKIREVYTISQFSNEFSTFEAKRALAKRVDLVLGETPIFKMLGRILGREFYKLKKLPLSINLNKTDWKIEIGKALIKTQFNISLKGLTSTLSVGYNNLRAEDLTENILTVSNWLARKFPGRWANVAKLSISAGESPPLVIYFSKGSRNEVKSCKTSGGAIPEPVEDEISTQIGKKIKVYPQGKIEIRLCPEDD